MPRYFFHVIDGRALMDKVGTQLADLDEARTQAIETATELLRRSSNTIWNGCPWQMTVANASGDTLLNLRFSAHDYGRAQ